MLLENKFIYHDLVLIDFECTVKMTIIEKNKR